MKIVAISDTHQQHKNIKEMPDGDVLVHSGDMTNNGSLGALKDFAKWFSSFPHENKICIFGNHETFDNDQDAVNIIQDNGIIYLEDSGIDISGNYFYGTPWVPKYYNWAKMLPRNGNELWEKRSLIPVNTNVLICHCPPFGILDKTPEDGSLGCELLTERINELHNLKTVLFGHIHEGYGQKTINYPIGDIQFINAAICDGGYHPNNKPTAFEI